MHPQQTWRGLVEGEGPKKKEKGERVLRSSGREVEDGCGLLAEKVEDKSYCRRNPPASSKKSIHLRSAEPEDRRTPSHLRRSPLHLQRSRPCIVNSIFGPFFGRRSKMASSFEPRRWTASILGSRRWKMGPAFEEVSPSSKKFLIFDLWSGDWVEDHHRP